MSNKNFGLDVVKNDLATTGDFLKDVQAEIIEEEHKALKDFIKGAYRLQMEKEREAVALNKQIEELKKAVEAAGKGKWDLLAKIRIPARFFDESTLRKHGKSLIEHSAELRFADLYADKEI